MDRLASACEEAARFRSLSKKTAILAAYLGGLIPEDRERALRFLRGEPAGGRPAVGPATFLKALCRASGWDAATVRQCRREAGDTGETVALLMAGASQSAPLPLAEAERLLEALARQRSAPRKAEILEACFRRHAPAALKYFVRTVTGNLRIDCPRSAIEEAAGGTPVPACATLDVVVTAAGPAEYTLGVRSGRGFTNVGKAAADLGGDEIRELALRMRAAATERFGGTVLVRPEIVLEAAFDGVRKSPRHKSGYALVSPRIVRWRRDRRPEEAASLERIKELYEASLC